ncbi:DUF3099 domain-containing protein [Streptomyces sp. 71268]|uniref:DUF3099 domain-containing protein n=1 Tax=Streptomyces sp. 71268 TaxID=3002640 RepID=UPI0023F7154A|nr:DUF3099 domain-containing protein [Streptomyces sp. 71268]WEV27036.1 DUF3099 domain-containing protein [Streptomyces sp. 71268]
MYARRRRGYFLMMGACLTLFVSAWAVVRLWSVPVAVGMCVVAMVIPPLAAIVANRRGPDDRWFDEPPPRPPGQRTDHAPGAAPDLGLWPDPDQDAAPRPPPPHPGARGGSSAEHGARTGDPESDAWWDELDGKHHP